MKLQTMESSNKKVQLKSSQGKIVMYQEQSNLAFQLLVISQLADIPVNTDELMHYPLALVPHALGSPDVFFTKTNKASIIPYLLKDVDTHVSYPDGALFIDDINTTFHSMTNIPSTFGEIYLQILDRLSHKKDFLFSTDAHHLDSVKSQERLRRG